MQKYPTPYHYEYPRPAVTATVVLFYRDKILVGKRWTRTRAYPGYWCLPGGFLDAKTSDHPGERIENTAVREVLEETCIGISESQLNLFDINSDPEVDPRGHTVNACYWVELSTEQFNQACQGDDLAALEWICWDSFDINERPYAFNHGIEIIPKAIFAFEEYRFKNGSIFESWEDEDSWVDDSWN